MIGYAARRCGVSQENLQIGPLYYAVWTSKGNSGLTERSSIPHPTVSGRTCDIVDVQLYRTRIETSANGCWYTVPGVIRIEEAQNKTPFGEGLSDSELQRLHVEVKAILDRLKPYLAEQRFIIVELPPLEGLV